MVKWLRSLSLLGGLLVVLAVGCGDDKGTNSSSGSNSAIEDRLKRIIEPDFKPSFKIKVSSGTEPTFTWSGGNVNEIWVFDVEVLLAAPLEDLAFYFTGGRMWNEDCDGVSDCLSSPQVYDGYDELEVGKEYAIAVVTGADHEWGYKVFTVEEE